MGTLDGKVALITGGGKAKSVAYGITSAFAHAGANVVITGRNKGKLDGARELEEQGVRVLPVQVDGYDEAVAKKVVEAAVEEFGRIDVLVNCAQAAKSGIPLAQQKPADLQLAIESGLYATFHYMQACYPYLKQTNGTVINLASGAAMTGQAGQATLAAAKEGIRGMSLVAATEWAPDGITVNCICPLAQTAQLETWQNEFPEAYEQFVSNIPAGRLANAQADVGETCVFLASDSARFITGQTIQLQGGLGLRA